MQINLSFNRCFGELRDGDPSKARVSSGGQDQQQLSVPRPAGAVPAADRLLVAGQLTVLLQPADQPPHRRIEPVDRPGQDGQPLDPKIMPPPVDQLVGQDPLPLLRTQLPLRKQDPGTQQSHHQGDGDGGALKQLRGTPRPGGGPDIEPGELRLRPVTVRPEPAAKAEVTRPLPDGHGGEARPPQVQGRPGGCLSPADLRQN